MDGEYTYSHKYFNVDNSWLKLLISYGKNIKFNMGI